MLSLYSKLLLAINLGIGWASPFHNPRDTTPRAAYFLDNDPAGDFIVSLKISIADGTLSSPVRTSTVCNGLAGLVAVSQDSVVVSNDV